MSLSTDTIVGVVGAGAMGTGIAQVAAAAGHRVILGDAMHGATQKAQASLAKTMDREVQKERMSRDAADEVMARIEYQWSPLGDDVTAYKDCGLVIEAIVEDLDAKQTLFRRLEQAMTRDAVLATNTSSLSVASIASACAVSERVIGIHFFNPPPLMPLVEIVPWLGTDPTLAPAALRADDALAKDAGARVGHAGVHRQSRRAAVLWRIASPVRRRRRRHADDRLGDEASSVDFAWARSS